MSKLRRLTEDEVAWLLENYGHMSNEELAEHLGVALSTIKSRRAQHGLRKDPEYLSEMRRRDAVNKDSYKRLQSPEIFRKRRESLKKRYESERIRIKWGLGKRTGLNLRNEPRAKYCQRYRLEHLGYIVDEKELVAYWTESTHRAKRLEALGRGVRKGNLISYYSFRSLAEKKEKL